VGCRFQELSNKQDKCLIKLSHLTFLYIVYNIATYSVTLNCILNVLFAIRKNKMEVARYILASLLARIHPLLSQHKNQKVHVRTHFS
jgi:hypothetical protein